MPEQVRCPSCNAPLRVPDNLLGKNVKCPKCQTTFTAEMEDPTERQSIVREPAPARRSRAMEETEEEEFLEEEEEEERPRRRRRRRGRSFAAAQSAVAGPAVALMVVGGIAIGLAVIGLVLNLLGVGFLAAAAPKGMERAQGTARMVGGVVGAILGICYGGIITSGGAKMKNLSSYGYAMTACIVAMLPCSLCCLLGLPFGIWGLVVINKPEVKNAFR